MRKNDIIAEYIETRYPHLLKTADFTLFGLSVICREACKNITELAKRVLSVLDVSQSDTSNQGRAEEKDDV